MQLVAAGLSRFLHDKVFRSPSLVIRRINRRVAAVPAKPDTLVWARLSLGMSRQQAAELLDISTETLAAWESDEQHFRIGELRKIASKYKKPVAAFLRSTTPTLPGGPEDFRTVGGREATLSTDTLGYP